MGRSDIGFLALNLAFLGALILLPISTSFLSAGTSVGRLAYSGNLFLASAVSFFLRLYARRIDPQAFGSGRLLLSPALSMVFFAIAAAVSLHSEAATIALWWCALASPWIDKRWGAGAVE